MTAIKIQFERTAFTQKHVTFSYKVSSPDLIASMVISPYVYDQLDNPQFITVTMET